MRSLISSLLSLAALVACTAPPSRPAGGEIAVEIRAALESGDESFDHSLWNELLAGGTLNGRVDYDFMAARRNTLDVYLEDIASVDLGSLSGPELEALLFNAYNALTVRSILDHPGVASIREIDGVWKKARHQVGGFDLTLDEIEHNLLRPYFNDPRVHFAVNCASSSCAPLPPWSFAGDELEAQLEERTRSFLTDPANVRIENGTLYLSSYFTWYGGDFVAEGWSPRADTVPLFIGRYATPEVAGFIQAADGEPTVEYLDYDWSLNRTIGAAD